MPGKNVWIFGIWCFMLASAFDDFSMFAGERYDNMIAVIYNNVPGDMSTGLQVAGGFSAFIIFDQHKILFDTGGDSAILIENVRAMGFDTEGLDAVVISHNHWDHAYGLPGIFQLTEKVPAVYVPASSRDSILQQNPRLDVVPVCEPLEILSHVWSTGELKTSYRDIMLYEQALVLDGESGLYVITGCAHPGIIEIIKRVKGILPSKPIALVAGGFHLVNAGEAEIRDISARLKALGVMNIAPSHCTGNLAMNIFKEEWVDQYQYLYLGQIHRF